MTSALILGALFFLCCMVLFLGVREQSGECAIYSIEVFHVAHSDNGSQVTLLCGRVNQPDQILTRPESSWKADACLSCVNSAPLGPAGVRIERRSSCLADLKKLIGHVSYRRLVLGFLFTSLAFQVWVFAQADQSCSVEGYTGYSRRKYTPLWNIILNYSKLYHLAVIA